MVQAYIRRRSTSGTNGRQLNINIFTIKRTKGTPPNKINIPGVSAESQVTAPILGQQDNFDIVIRIKKEDVNVAFDVTIAGSTSAHSPTVLSISDQYNFLYDEVVNNLISSHYEVFIDWIGVTFRGTLLLDDNAITAEEFGQEILITMRLDRGLNPFYTAVAGIP